MLETIKITNLALITKSQVDFGTGFNVLTGETGAGKSLLVDALLFLNGNRADKTLIKSGEDFARVEGVFAVDLNNSQINEILSSVGLENEGTLLVSRYFSLSGKNECRINGEIVTLNILRKITNEIMDIFGQNDSMALLDPQNHLKIIDDLISDKLNTNKELLRSKLEELDNINKQISYLGGIDKDRENNIKLLEFQIKEIEDANLKINEEDECKAKIKIMENSEKIYSSINDSINVLDGEYSLSNAIKTAINYLSSIMQFDESISNEKDRLYSCKYELEDIVSTLSQKQNEIHYDERELDELNDRLTFIKDLERKYGNTIEDVLKSKNDFEDRLNILVNSEQELQRLTLNKSHILDEIISICLKLRQIRTNEIVWFKSAMEQELFKLGMKNAKVDVVFQNEISKDNIEKIVNLDGADKIEFLFSANLGFEPRPLSRIISGGEMSRFMLAMKSLANSKTNKTCIFDEIDSGIGGEIGYAIGEKICEISRNSQVICITHLAQIACFGDSNFKIEKFDEDGKTITTVSLLNENQKVKEIARMLGSSQSESSQKLAMDMLDASKVFKSRV